MLSPAQQPNSLSSGRRVLISLVCCLALLWLGGSLFRLAAAAGLILLVPGYLLERTLPGPRLPLLLRFALWIGLSLSGLVLLYQFAWIGGVALSTPILALLLGGLSLAALVGAWRELPPTPLPAPPWGLIWPTFALICWIGFGLRSLQIENLALPPWVDSVHHALLVRIAIEQGGVPIDLRPALPIAELTYHWGFHVLAAALIQLSGVDLAGGLLWIGQWLNGLHAPLAAALAYLFRRRPEAALGAALTVGLLSYFPAYYLSWGRYTQLTGLLLVPAAAIAWQYALERRSWQWWAAASLLAAGLLLIHVRVLIFLGVLLAAQTILWALQQRLAEVLRAAPGIAAAALATLLLCAPWLALLARQIVPTALEQPQNFVAESSYAVVSTSLLWAGDGLWLTTLALLAAAGGLWRRQQAPVVLALWIAGLLLLAQPALATYLLPAVGTVVLLRNLNSRRWPIALIGAACLLINPLTVRLPATWLISGDSVTISLFLPLGVALGSGLADLALRLRRYAPARLINMLLVVAVIGLGLWGAERQREIVNPGTVFATAADLAAIEWVRSNTAPEARFLINTTPWLGVAQRGVDGGWWLLPLADRWTSTPPVIFTYGPPAYVAEVIAIGTRVAAYQPGAEASIRDLVAQQSIDYLYLSERSGPLRVEQFAGLPWLRTVYARDGVTILAVESQS